MEYISKKDYYLLFDKVIATYKEEGYTPQDLSNTESILFIEEMITDVVDEFIALFDGFNFVNADLGQYQRKELIKDLLKELTTKITTK